MTDQSTFGVAGVMGWPVAHPRSPRLHLHVDAQDEQVVRAIARALSRSWSSLRPSPRW